MNGTRAPDLSDILRAILLFALTKLAVVLVPVQAHGDELAEFLAIQSESYASYREAAFYTRTGNTAVAALALDDFVTGWSRMVDRYGENPPKAFAGDPQWKGDLDRILDIAGAALEQLDADDAAGARETLLPVRGIWRDMRRRSGVETFSDHVDALSEAMDLLAVYRSEIKSLDDAGVVAKVRAQADLVDSLFAKCRSEASADVAADPEFRRLVDGAAESMAKLRQSLENGNMRLYRIGIGELRSYERIMYLRFG